MEVFQSYKILLDAPCANESVEEIDAPSLVIRSTSPPATERLLAYNGSGTFFVVIDISCCVAELVGRKQERFAVRGEADKS
jgi:hypothetical protein